MDPSSNADHDLDLIVIPARYGSTRLPGKPLLPLGGKTVLQRVIANALSAAQRVGHCEVVVATDDERIAAHAQDAGVASVMTSQDLVSGTDRAHAAAQLMNFRPRRVINVQGDAPFIAPATIEALIASFRKSTAPVATLVCQLDWNRLDKLRQHKLNAPFSGTTCLRDSQDSAIWFSKTILPSLRNMEELRQEPMSPIWQHLGVYAYTLEALNWFVGAPQSQYEILEGLEQLRFLENGWTVATVPVSVPEYALTGIDTPHDMELAERHLAEFGEPCFD